MKSEKSKTSERNRFNLDLTDKLNISEYYLIFKISDSTWNDTDLPQVLVLLQTFKTTLNLSHKNMKL